MRAPRFSKGDFDGGSKKLKPKGGGRGRKKMRSFEFSAPTFATHPPKKSKGISFPVERGPLSRPLLHFAVQLFAPSALQALLVASSILVQGRFCLTSTKVASSIIIIRSSSQKESDSTTTTTTAPPLVFSTPRALHLPLANRLLQFAPRLTKGHLSLSSPKHNRTTSTKVHARRF